MQERALNAPVDAVLHEEEEDLGGGDVATDGTDGMDDMDGAAGYGMEDVMVKHQEQQYDLGGGNADAGANAITGSGLSLTMLSKVKVVMQERALIARVDAVLHEEVGDGEDTTGSTEDDPSMIFNLDEKDIGSGTSLETDIANALQVSRELDQQLNNLGDEENKPLPPPQQKNHALSPRMGVLELELEATHEAEHEAELTTCIEL